MNFFIATYNEDAAKWRYKYRDIAEAYIRGWFWVDVVRGDTQRATVARGCGDCCTRRCLPGCSQVSVMPFDVIGFILDSKSVAQLKLLRFVRLLRLMKLVRIAKMSRCVFQRVCLVVCIA
jgi:hypothetical protein